MTRRLLLLTITPLVDDPRASRAAAAASAAGLQTVAVAALPATQPHVGPSGGRLGGGALAREVRGIARLARLAVRTAVMAGRAARLPAVDIVHAHDLDTLPAAWLVAKLRRARLVYDAHELYTDIDADPPRLWLGAARLIEAGCARSADAVVTVGPELAAELRRSLRLREDPIVVFNVPPLAPDVPEAGRCEALVAAYQAATGPGRDLSDLFVAIEHAPAVRAVIRVKGADVEHCRAAVLAHGIVDRVTVVPPVPPQDVVTALAGADVGLMIDRPQTRNIDLALPNKLFEYMMAGLAVVVPRTSALGPLVEREGVGITYEPGDPLDMGRALRELSSEPDTLLDMRRRARRLAVERFNAEAQLPAVLRAWGCV